MPFQGCTKRKLQVAKAKVYAGIKQILSGTNQIAFKVWWLVKPIWYYYIRKFRPKIKIKEKATEEVAFSFI